ncbi:STE/STE7/MEK4 protein kinase [Aphelenchoides avenae]|nr:STE/STE7/MEK4 protein kinase [Aphelenchus avenae]
MSRHGRMPANSLRAPRQPQLQPRPSPSVPRQESSDDHIVPDGTKDVQMISYMYVAAKRAERFIRMFMSGKLVFADKKEHRFGIEDLKDMGEIGRGRFGRVNKMLHVPTGNCMAVKRVRLITNKFDDSDDTRLMKQLQNEVRTIEDASSCPEVVSFYGLTFHEGDCLICMELMDISLEKLYKTVHHVAKERFDETVLGIVGVSVLRALNNLKQLKRIIHRDVKPSNIVLNIKGQIKLCDFGISGYLEDSIARTKDVGCRPYMAPERLTAEQEEYDIRTDVWSLGITLMETARGEFPYPNFNDQCIFKQIQQVVMGDPLFMSPVDNYSSRTVQFVNLCLTKEYVDRPTYDDLMNTDFYQYYATFPDREEHVKRYVERMLLVADNWELIG